MTTEEFEARFGRKPSFGEFEQANCIRVGELFHFTCGICERCNELRAVCGHFAIPEVVGASKVSQVPVLDDDTELVMALVSMGNLIERFEDAKALVTAFRLRHEKAARTRVLAQPKILGRQEGKEPHE